MRGRARRTGGESPCHAGVTELRMRLPWAARSTAKRSSRSVSPDDVGGLRWAVDLEPPTPAAEEDEATGSQVDWDEDGRPVFTVFFASGTSQRYVDDERAWRAVEVFGVSRPPARRLR